MCEGLPVEDPGPLVRTLYGRQKGKKLRRHQADLLLKILPNLAIDCSRPIKNPSGLFPHPPVGMRLEIGFGGAEHLVNEARQHPDVGYLACEPFLNGVAKLLVQIEDLGLTNIRIHHGDAREVLTRLPSGCLERVDVLYPDPWPKWRQRKRRFLSRENITEIARVLQLRGELRFATDIDDYAGWVLSRIRGVKDWHWMESNGGTRTWNDPWVNWPGTRYETKAICAGRKPVYLTFMRVGS
jgi:tRNA (guanine-N7-)-methyltransferase